MPYSRWSDVNPAIRGIKPRVTLGQANVIAGYADAIEGDDVESPWAVAIAQFKKSYRVEDGKWVKRKASEMGEMGELSERVASDHLVVEDPEKESTWHLPVRNDGVVSHRLMGAAWAALHGGYRGNKYEGPKKAEAIRKLKALYKAEDMELPEAEVQQAPLFSELYDNMEEPYSKPPAFVPWSARSFDDVRQAEEASEYDLGIRKLTYIFTELFHNVMYGRLDDGSEPSMADRIGRVRELVDEFNGEIERLSSGMAGESAPDDNLALILAAATGEPMAEATDATNESELEVAVELVAGSFAESATGHAIELVEVEEGRTEYDGGPLKLHMALIEPGWGNRTDNNYYSREMLARDAKVFEGGKMYATDHRPGEKSVLTEVADILACPDGFVETGAPVALVGIHNPAFAQDVWNRNELGTLANLHCSIIGDGKVRPGFEQGGRRGKYVEAIERGSADFVTQAGAGGRALALAESNGGDEVTKEKRVDEGQEKEDVSELGPAEDAAIREREEGDATEAQPEGGGDAFSAEDAAALINEATLPDAAKAQLLKREYASREVVEREVESAKDLVEALTGSGRVFGLGPGEPPKPMTNEELAEKQYAILRRRGIQIPGEVD